MPADNTFEEHMQQQLDALRIQPPASDWQQIHAALHPAKRRRIIWWWLPLAALLISGAIYLAKEPSGAAREGREPMVRAMGNEKRGNNEKAITEKVVGNEVTGNDNTGNDGKAKSEKAIGKNEEGASNEIMGNDRKAITKEAIGNNKERKGGNQNRNGLILKRQLPTGQAIKEKQPSGIDVEANTATAEGKKLNFKSAFITAAEKTTPQDVARISSIPADTASPKSNVVTEQADEEAEHRLTESIHSTTMKLLPESHAPWPWVNEKFFTPKPRNNTPRKWQTGWWAALGSTRLSQTASFFGTAKAAADFSSNNPGNVRYVSSRTEKNGQYFSAGWVLRKPMGKRWAFSTGLGAGLQSWQVSTSVFADSILPTGSLYNRALTATSDQQYRMLTLQVPMLLEWKLLGKQEGIWLQGGLNHQWLLQLREKQSVATLSQNFASTSNTNDVTSKAYGWQPQLRLGLVYQWQSKRFIHQMVPAVQLPLRSVFKTDNRGLLNIQLQYNMLWLRK
ncbi:MAG: PorT family protein [Bacteroidetes bacterium]|uniref:outer membrane beta-barrel protein n=1 Tax=Phnomibacter sp. TaxID=2836217 RepID=UPI002FDDF199|nr:PorT family protein [Bacteroidota bacterium]